MTAMFIQSMRFSNGCMGWMSQLVAISHHVCSHNIWNIWYRVMSFFWTELEINWIFNWFMQSIVKINKEGSKRDNENSGSSGVEGWAAQFSVLCELYLTFFRAEAGRQAAFSLRVSGQLRWPLEIRMRKWYCSVSPASFQQQRNKQTMHYINIYQSLESD